MTRRCSTCRWLDVPPDAKGRRVVRQGNAYTCTWPAPTAVPWADSVTQARDFTLQPYRRTRWPCTAGTTCPTWEPLDNPEAGEE
jgi:hypothetical protein